MTEPVQRVVRVERKVTVVTYSLASNYVNRVPGRASGKGSTVPMADDEIRECELNLSGEDAFNSLVEAGSVADEADIDLSCKVEFVNEDDLPDEVKGRVI